MAVATSHQVTPDRLVCSRCAKRIGYRLVLDDQRVCVQCYCASSDRKLCPRCDRLTWLYANVDDLNICPHCAGRRHANCCNCGTYKRAFRIGKDDVCCACRGRIPLRNKRLLQRVKRCSHCGEDYREMGSRCRACALRETFRIVFGDVDGNLTAPLARAEVYLLASRNRESRITWLRSIPQHLRDAVREGSRDGPILESAILRSGRHENVSLLLAILRAAGATIVDETAEQILRCYFERFILPLVPPNARLLARQYMQFDVLARLRLQRRRPRRRLSIERAFRADLRCVARFLCFLAESESPLETCSANRLDQFLGREAAGYLLNPFLVWAYTSGHLRRRLCARRPRSARHRDPVSDEQLRELLGRCKDETLEERLRLVLFLVCVWARPLRQIVQIRRDDICRIGGEVKVRVGAIQIPIFGEFGLLSERVAARADEYIFSSTLRPRSALSAAQMRRWLQDLIPYDLARVHARAKIRMVQVLPRAVLLRDLGIHADSVPDSMAVSAYAADYVSLLLNPNPNVKRIALFGA